MAREGLGATVLEAQRRAAARAPGSDPSKRKGRMGRFLHVLGKGLPDVKGWPTPLVLLILPYIFAYVMVMLLIIVAFLVGLLIWMAVKLALALPTMLLHSVASRSSVFEGAHREIADDDQLFGTTQAPDDRLQELRSLGLGVPGETDALTMVASSLWGAWQRSFVSGDVDGLRPTMTEGYWRLHRLLVQARATQGVERVFDGAVTGAEIESAHHRSGADEVRLRISCSGTCYDRAGGSVLRGATSPTTWVEHLTIRRGQGGAGSGDLGILPSTCLNCGAPLQLGEDGQCTTCGALAAPRAGEWALANTWRASW